MCNFCFVSWHTNDDLPTFSARVQKLVDEALWEDRNAWLGDFVDGYLGDDEDWDYNFVYTREFQKLVVATALAMDLFVDAREAVIWRSLSDRYVRRPEWSFDILCAAYWESSIETPDEEHVKEYWSTRAGKSARAVKQIEAGQESWL